MYSVKNIINFLSTASKNKLEENWKKLEPYENSFPNAKEFIKYNENFYIMENKKQNLEIIIQRVKEEQIDLANKISKLDKFLKNKIIIEIIGELQYNLLQKQKEIMNDYLDILNLRLKNFKKQIN